jgi:putative transcriptional regulator
MRPSLLRDTPRLTRLLVLGEVRDRRPSTLQPVAEALEITSQAVSNYMKELQEDGLVERDEGAYVLTTAGHQALQEGVREVKNAVDEAARRYDAVETTAAVAAEALDEGDVVGLVLEEGVLHAVPRQDAPATGTALRAAAPGEDVPVRDLTGVVDLIPGTVWVLRVPSARRGGSAAVDPDALVGALEGAGVDADRVAVLGVTARVVARQSGLAPDIAFAPVESAHHAARLGLDVLLLVARDRLPDALGDLESLQGEEIDPVPVELLDAPGEGT